jgi:hypothetical protein
MEVKAEGNKIYFLGDGILASTDYTETVWKEIKSRKWHINWSKDKYGKKTKGYIRCGKLYLHQLVMQHWYGQDVYEQAMLDGCVIDHIDNNSFDCCINNLSYIPKNVNTAKGQVYDIERKDAIPIVALNFFKDFYSGNYQITMGFNEPTSLENPDGSYTGITAIRLLYPNDYRRTFQDASTILYEFTTHGRFNLDKLNFIDKEIEETIYVKGATNGAFVKINGEEYLVLDKNTKLIRVAPSDKLFNRK